MQRLLIALAVCATLSACATSGGLPSLSGIGGSNEPGNTAKPADPPPAAAASEKSSGGIWSNFSSIFSSGEQAPAQKVDVPALDANEALRLVNEYRAKKGLHALALDPRATAAAAALAEDMAKHDRMSHIGPDGADMAKRLTIAGYPYRLAAENVGVGQPSLAQMIDGWKKSPPHSRNMLLRDAKHLGIAYEYNPNSKYKNFWALVVAAP